MVTCRDVRIEKGVFPSKLTFCMLQLRSPFFGEADIIVGAEYPFLGWKHNAHEQRKKRLENCLNCIRLFDRHVNVVVLPEYSVSEDMLVMVSSFVRENRTVVIGTFYDAVERIARTFAAIPAKEGSRIETGCKTQRSHHDVNVLRELGEDEKCLLRLRWGRANQKKTMLILSCKDFLEWPDFEHDIKDSDILISPMCSAKMNSFVNTAEGAIRWVRPGETRTRSRVCVLCNAIDDAEDGLGICGESQIVGPSRIEVPTVPPGIEGGLLVDVDTSKLITLPTPITGQDRQVIEAASIFRLDRTWSIEWIEWQEARQPRLEIHPNVPFRLGLSKYYFFVRMRDYSRYLEQLKTTPFGCTSLFGYHDLIFYAFEDSWQFLALRVQACFDQDVVQHFESWETESLRVTGILKYRGQMFADIQPTQYGYYRADLLRNLLEEDVDFALQQIRAFAEGSVPEPAVREKLVASGVLLEHLDPSDVREIDRVHGKSEFFVLVFFLEGRKGPSATRIFEEHVLHAELANDDRVRTIERCEPTMPVAPGVCHAHYVIHVVGHLIDDIKEIVLKKIHSKIRTLDVECGTRVVPIADTLAPDTLVSLRETVLVDPVNREMICQLIEDNVRERDPFIIKSLEKRYLDLLATTWHKASLWTEFRKTKQVERSVLENTRSQLARCLYRICHALNGREEKLPENVIISLWEYCKGFYMELATKIEGLLKQFVSVAADRVGDDFLPHLSQAWERGTRKNEKVEFHDLSKMTLGTLMQAIIYWNDYRAQEYLIGSPELAKKLRRLQGSGFADFRDCFAHEAEGEEASVRKHLQSRKDCRRLLTSIDEGLRFILEEKYRYESFRA